MLTLEFYIPRALKDTSEVKEIENLLEKVNSSFKLKITKHIMNNSEEEALKSKILWGLAVAKRIKISQTRKSKILFSQLIVKKNGEAITFYPQARTSKKISIMHFLDGLLNGQVMCLHEKYEIEDELGVGI